MKVTCEHCQNGTCGLGAANRKKQARYKGHRFFRELPPRCSEVLSEDAMKKPQSADRMASTAAAEACDWMLDHSGIFAFLTDSKWEDGTRRELGTMMVFFEDGWWKVMINDKALKRLAFVSGDTYADVMLQVEDGLNKDSLDWRRAKVWKK